MAPDLLSVWIKTVVNYPSDIEPLELGRNYTNEQMTWHKLVLRDPLLHPSEKVIAGIIMHMINREQGYAFPAIETLAEEAQLSRSTARRALDQLRNLGWIWTEDVGRNRSLHYRLSCSASRRATMEEATQMRRAERDLRREKRGLRTAFGSRVGPPVNLLKAHGRASGRVLDDPTGGVISEPQTHLTIPANETRLRSNSFGRAAGHPVSDRPADAIVIGAGLPQEEIYFYLGRHFVGWSKVPVDKKEAAVYQIAARGLTRKQAREMAEALGCQLGSPSF
jgi:DNA-binding MarR family transcriptional regulator